MSKSTAGLRTNRHWPTCIVRNRLTAYLAVIYSTGMVWASAHQLRKPFSGVHFSSLEQWVLVYGSALLLCFFIIVKCAYERLWLGMALLSDGIRVAPTLFPNILASATRSIRTSVLILWAAAELVSLFFAVSAHHAHVRSDRGGTQTGDAK